MRLSTHGKPRVISCAELHPRHVALPRGCLDEAVALSHAHGVASRLVDRRDPGRALPVRFLGALRPEQVFAADALARHDIGVLAAATAFGKTVVAASLIARRQCSAPVLVHRRELLTQWVERLASYLSVDRAEIGVIGGGRTRPTGRLDVAVLQSLVRRGVVSDAIPGTGVSSSTNAITCPRRASSWSPAGRRRGTSSASPRRSRGATGTTRSS